MGRDPVYINVQQDVAATKIAETRPLLWHNNAMLVSDTNTSNIQRFRHERQGQKASTINEVLFP